MTPEPRPSRRTARRSAAAGLLTLAVVVTPVAVSATAGAVGAEPTVLTPIGGGYETPRSPASRGPPPRAPAARPSTSWSSRRPTATPTRSARPTSALAQQRTDQVDAACDAAVRGPVHRVHGHPGGAAQPGRRHGPGQLRGPRRRPRPTASTCSAATRRSRWTCSPDSPAEAAITAAVRAAGRGARRHQRRRGRRVAQHDQRLHHPGRQPRARPAARLDPDVVGRRRRRPRARPRRRLVPGDLRPALLPARPLRSHPVDPGHRRRAVRRRQPGRRRGRLRDRHPRHRRHPAVGPVRRQLGGRRRPRDAAAPPTRGSGSPGHPVGPQGADPPDDRRHDLRPGRARLHPRRRRGRAAVGRRLDGTGIPLARSAARSSSAAACSAATSSATS